MSEASLLEQVFRELVVSGPVALVLGLLAWGLWSQNKELMRKNDRQNKKMLKLAVRVQRAIEVLAGLNAPEVEELLDDDGDEDEDEEDEKKPRRRGSE